MDMCVDIMIDEQEKLLQDAKKNAKDQAYFMRKALQNADLKSGLKHASLMLMELKTNVLSPRNYYVLFMAVFDYMRELESFFKEDALRGRRMQDVYEAVQQAPQIIPRLYLLITAGSVFIQSHENGSEKILDDMMEMLKAVQNPLRGLFLRYYFLKMCKDRLPDSGSEYSSQTRGVEQAIQTIHLNLRESTNLWLRIGGNRERAKRLKDKNDLKTLIGENLMRISSLEGVNIKVYKLLVLPKMLALIQWTKDSMAQEYLLDCMIQGFPQEFHINTLPQLLECCSKECEKEMDMKAIFIALMNRLSAYLTDSGNVIQNIQKGFSIYQLFSLNIKSLVHNSQSSQIKSTLNLYSAFLQFTLKCYPTKHEYVNEILRDAYTYCATREASIDDECQLFISKFLIHPLETLANVILTAQEYPKFMKYLKFKRRREVAKQISRCVARGSIDLTDQTLVTQLLSFIEPLLIRQPDYQEVPQLVFREEQYQISKMVFQVQNQDVTLVWNILKKLIQKFMQGGDERMQYTIPSTVFRLLRLAIQIHSTKDETTEPKVYKRIFQMARNLIEKITHTHPVLAVKLSLQLVLLIDRLDQTKFYDEYIYESAGQLLTVYESQITDPKLKKQVLQLIINAFLRLRAVSEENYDTLVSNTINFCSKILKKNEQCLILLKCCYLFTNPLADANRIHEVLKRCAKLANTCISQSLNNLSLFLQITESYLFFVKQKNIIEDKDEAIAQIAEIVQAKLIQPIPNDCTPHVTQCKLKWDKISLKIKE